MDDAEVCPVCYVADVSGSGSCTFGITLGPCGHKVCPECASSMVHLGMQADREFPRCEICATDGCPVLPSAAESALTGLRILGSKDTYGPVLAVI
jgi:hypothetical protein